MSDTIAFNKESIQEYLDNAIRRWRIRKADAIKMRGDEANPEGETLIAMCYVDAFQSVRTSLFGELLEIEE